MTDPVGVVVVGMGRSGTSAVTGMFTSAGFFAGRDDDLMPASESNPAGHWENLNIWRANEQILHRLKGSWFDPPTTAAQITAREWAIPMLLAEVERVIEYADGAPVAIKDPRIGVMMPLWHQIIKGRLHPVLVIRDPVEIARSLYCRDGIPLAFALACWELHMTTLLDYLSEGIVTVAPYASLLDDTELRPLIVGAAADHIEHSRATYVRPQHAFGGGLDVEFRRNRVEDGDREELLTSRQLGLWQFLSSLPHGDWAIDVPTVLRRPSATARAGARSETERAQLVQCLEASHAQTVDFETKLASERERGATLAAKLDSEQEWANGLAEALADEQQHSARLSAELSAERERANAAQAAHLRAEGWLAAIQGSVSWRITVPLRTAKGELGRRRRARDDLRRFPWLDSESVPPPKGIMSIRRVGIRKSSRPVRSGNGSPFPCEIHIPISPTQPFLTKLHYLVASLRLFGGALADSPVIVTVGGDEPIDLARAHPWSQRLGIEWRWLDDSLWRRYGIFGTALQRFCYEIEAPNALLLDADTLFVQPIDDLLEATGRCKAIAGVIAHVSPFIGYEGEQDLWEQIFKAAGLEDPALVCEHSGWQVIEFSAARRYCPPYFNLGVLIAQRGVFSKLAESIYSEMETLERIHPTPFRCQLALTMAMMRSDAQWRELPLRFNLPNIAQYLPRHHAELADARIIHYLKDDEINRAEDLASVESIGGLLTRNGLNPINMRLREALGQVHERVASEA